MGPWQTVCWGSHLHLTKTEGSEEAGSFLVCFKGHRLFYRGPTYNDKLHTQIDTLPFSRATMHKAQSVCTSVPLRTLTCIQPKFHATCNVCAYTQGWPYYLNWTVDCLTGALNSSGHFSRQCYLPKGLYGSGLMQLDELSGEVGARGQGEGPGGLV